jgi:hypothetical protein
VIGAVARRRASWVALALTLGAVLTACTGAGGDPSPSPSISLPSPSPTPSVTVDADGRALPGFVTTSAELPAAQPAPAGLLEQTGPGWSLQTYRPQVEPVTTVRDVIPGFAATVHVLYLVSPQGQRYQLLELDPATPLLVESWSAGETVAYVRQCSPLDCDPAAKARLLDLTTGELGPLETVDDSLHVGATLPGSVRWWQNGSDRAAIENGSVPVTFARGWVAASASPAGDFLAVTREDTASAYASAGMAIVDAQTGAITDLARLWLEPLECEPFRWRADGALDVSCWDAQRSMWRLFAVGPGADEMKENKSATATPPEDGPWVEPDFFVSDGVWAGPFTADGAARTEPGPEAIGLARNAGFEQLTVPDVGVGSARVVAVAAGLVFVEATQANNLSMTSAWAYDPAADTWAELASLPPGGPTRGLLATQGSPASGMTSWAIAP